MVQFRFGFSHVLGRLRTRQLGPYFLKLALACYKSQDVFVVLRIPLVKLAVKLLGLVQPSEAPGYVVSVDLFVVSVDF